MKYGKLRLTAFLLAGVSMPVIACAQSAPATTAVTDTQDSSTNVTAPNPFVQKTLATTSSVDTRTINGEQVVLPSENQKQIDPEIKQPIKDKDQSASNNESLEEKNGNPQPVPLNPGGHEMLPQMGMPYGSYESPINPNNVGPTNKIPDAKTRSTTAIIPNAQSSSSSPPHYSTGVENLGRAPITVSQNMTTSVTLSDAVASVYVADPEIVTVHPASNHRLVLFGVKTGQTAITAVDNNGNPIAHFVVTVVPSGYAAQQAEASMPKGAIAKEIPGAIKLSGTVQTPLDAVNADQTAKAATIGTNDTVLNGLNVAEPQQVMLQVKIAQMSRSVTQQLGINWQSIGSLGEAGLLMGSTSGASAARSAVQIGGNALGFNTSGNLIGSGSAGNYTLQFGHSSINAVLSMLDSDSLAHILAEPTLMALSGHTASFQSGGSFPVPIPGQNGQDSVEFQNYGVQLNFRPIVLSSGQIYLDVEPTVSQVSNLNSVTIGAGTSALVVPSLVQQTAKTTVMLGSGQTLAIAGLLEDQTNQSDTGVPGLSNVPVFGAAFKSDFYQRAEQELVILVTPYLVTPQSNPDTLHLAGQNWTPPNLVQRYLLGRQIGSPQQMETLPQGVGFLLK